ncbi:MAG: tRNA (adenosine(37)-N6)-dimethylallyltransferase MiaA [Candidatus Moraniibacteriota bacterium]|nr:MAG: tRNA (adenosine(37)-N6)-dimethylallyltransferase MiaA [Candidatus Moranbacteria bacterium]
MQQKTITIIGPTASGKSNLAITIAQKFTGEIISADSRQIYRHLDIGTGKEPGVLTTSINRGPHTKKAYICDGIPHYMIDIIHPTTEYNVAKFVKKARKIKDDIASRNMLPIICGGTMFWAQALLEKTDFPPVLPDKKLRKKLSTYSTEKLLAILKKYDPLYAQKVDAQNPVRIIRAIEIAKAYGHVPQITKKLIDPNKNLIMAIIHPKVVLHNRIEKRMDTWFDSGILDEIYKAHFTYKMPWTKLENFGLEYKWCTQYVRGFITYNTMRENTIRDLKHYAKRQNTWIRRWKKHGTTIHDVTTHKDALQKVHHFLQKD